MKYQDLPEIGKTGQLLATDQLCILVRPPTKRPAQFRFLLDKYRIFARCPGRVLLEIFERYEAGGAAANDQCRGVGREWHAVEVMHGM